MSSLTQQNFSCLACAMKPTIWLGRLTGLAPLTAHCGKRGQPPSFHISWYWIPVTILRLAAMTTSLYCLLANNQGANHIQLLEIVLDSLNGLMTLAIGCIFLTQLRKRVRGWNAIAKFVERCKIDVPNYALKDKEGEILYIAIRNSTLLVGLFAVQCGLIGYVGYTRSYAGFELVAFVTYELLTYLGGNIFLVTAFDFSGNIMLLESAFNLILERLHKMLDVALTNKYLKTKNFYTIVKSESAKPKLCDQLLELRSDYREVKRAMCLLNESYNYQILIITCMLIFVLVFEVYIFLVVMLSGFQYGYLLDLTIFGQSIASGVYMIFLSESLLDYSDKFCNCLFRADLSDFDDNELAQVEMFIKEVDTNPPLFNAFNIFNLQIRIITTLFSTITTYILVALQFKMQPAKLAD